MACGSCSPKSRLAPAALGAFDARAGSVFVGCMNGALLVPGESWSYESRTSFLRLLARDIDALAELGLDASGPTSLSEGPLTREQAAALAGWVCSYPMLRWGPDNGFWECIGMPYSEAKAAANAGAGPYWDMVSSAGRLIVGEETGVPVRADRSSYRPRRSARAGRSLGLISAVVLGTLLGVEVL